MFQNYCVYPFDRLHDTERICVLTEVAESISGYKKDLESSILNESTLYAVFAFMKSRVKNELDTASDEPDSDGNFLWRKRVLQAYEQVYNTSGADAGLTVECVKKSVWNTVINLLARSLFGESFWEKKRMFLSPNAAERPSFLSKYHLPPEYFNCRFV
jgi:hypothetical protein